MLRDRVQQTTSTPGNGGTFTLDGTVGGYQPVGAVYDDGKSGYFCVTEGSTWEIFEGVYHAGTPGNITRARLLSSSSGGPIAFLTTAKPIFSCEPAEVMGLLSGRLDTILTTNVAAAFTANYDISVPVWIDGMRGCLTMNAAAQGNDTLAVKLLAGKQIRTPLGAKTVAGAWRAGYKLEWRYDSATDSVIWQNAPDEMGVKVVSTTTYTVVAEDGGLLLIFANAAGCAVTLPQATGSFAAPFSTTFKNACGVGQLVTITPTTSTIDGSVNLQVVNGQDAKLRSDSTNYRGQFGAAPLLTPGISGLIPTAISGTNTTAVVTVSSGIASDSTAQKMLSYAGGNWAVSNGNAANGYQGGTTLPNSSTIHFFLAFGSSGICIFAHNALNPTLPAGYSSFSKRIFSLKTNASGALLPGAAIEVEGGALLFWLATQIQDVNVSNLSTARVMYPLTVPSGIKVEPKIREATSAGGFVLLTSGDETDVGITGNGAAPQFDVQNANVTNMQPFLTTDTSGQVGARASAGSTTLFVTTRGWKDWRR